VPSKATFPEPACNTPQCHEQTPFLVAHLRFPAAAVRAGLCIGLRAARQRLEEERVYGWPELYDGDAVCGAGLQTFSPGAFLSGTRRPSGSWATTHPKRAKGSVKRLLCLNDQQQLGTKWPGACYGAVRVYETRLRFKVYEMAKGDEFRELLKRGTVKQKEGMNGAKS